MAKCKPEHANWQLCRKCVGHDQCPWESVTAWREYCQFYLNQHSPNRADWVVPPVGNVVIIQKNRSQRQKCGMKI